MLLELHNLTVSFDGFVAVDHVNLSVEDGEKRVIIGPNGAGKTTIIDMITGKTKPTEGEILLNGVNISGKEPYEISDRYNIGRKFQGPNVFDDMTVYENLETALCGYSIMGPLSRPRSKILRVAVSRIILSSEASKVKLVGNLVA